MLAIITLERIVKDKDSQVDAKQNRDLREHLEQRRLSEGDTTLLIKLLDYLLYLLHTIEEAKISIHRLKKMIFGKGSGKSKKTVRVTDKSPSSSVVRSTDRKTKKPQLQTGFPICGYPPGGVQK